MNDIDSSLQIQEAKTVGFIYSIAQAPNDGDSICVSCRLQHRLSEITVEDGFMHMTVFLTVSFKLAYEGTDEEFGECSSKYMMKMRLQEEVASSAAFEEYAELVGLNTLIPFARAVVLASTGAMQTNVAFRVPLIDVGAMIDARKAGKV